MYGGSLIIQRWRDMCSLCDAKSAVPVELSSGPDFLRLPVASTCASRSKLHEKMQEWCDPCQQPWWDWELEDSRYTYAGSDRVSLYSLERGARSSANSFVSNFIAGVQCTP